MPSKGEVYRLINGIMTEEISVPSMNLLEFLEVYPDPSAEKLSPAPIQQSINLNP